MTKSHLSNLLEIVPDLLNRRILDLGAGRGNFMISVKQKGGDITGLETNPAYIQIAQAKAGEASMQNLKIIHGVGEQLPFEDASFDFVNMSEVLEHVQEPQKVLSEIFRVLSPGGKVYLSVPNRYGIYDPHYHLWFINWLPRFMTGYVIRMLGKSKESDGAAGIQALDQMHYYSYRTILKLLIRQFNFDVKDIREIKIKIKIGNRLMNFLVLGIYRMLRNLALPTFHLLIEKPKP